MAARAPGAVPGAVAPARMIELQRLAGNRALQRILSGGTYLYAPRTWMDTQFDDRADTVRQVLNQGAKRDLRKELFDNVKAATGIAASEVTEVHPTTELTRILTGDGYKPQGPTGSQKAQDRKAWRRTMARVLPDPNRILQLPADNTFRAADAATAPVKLTIHPKELVRATSDLGEVMNLPDVCSLIAIVKGVEGAYGSLDTKLGLKKSLAGEKAYYPKLHEHYFVTRHIEYDEPSTHPALFSEWGYTMIFSGDVSFVNLPTVLPKPLSPGKRYIFDIVGHTVYVKVRRSVPPGAAFKSEDAVLAALEFRSDNENYNKAEYKAMINYIYER